MGKNQKTLKVKKQGEMSTEYERALEELVENLNGVAGSVSRKSSGKLKSQRLLHSLSEIVDALDQTRTQLETKVAELAMVLEISQNLTEGLNISRITDFIAERAMSYLGADSAALMLMESDKQLTLIAAKGLSEHISEDARLPVGEGISGWVAKTGEPLILDAGRPRDWELLTALGREKVKSCVCVPLKYEAGIIGVIIITNVVNDRPFTQDNLQVLQIISDIAALAIENLRLFRKSQRNFLNTVAALAAAIDAKDAYTRGHSERVANYATAIAEEMKLPSQQRTSIETAALLHDIGKIGIPDDILAKPAKLTDKEYMVVKMHPYTGAQIIQPIEMLADVLPLVVAHHEKFDGTGYLEGAKGKEIPLGARIIAVADAFEAMTSERPHRSALEVEKAIKELREKAGTQFDPDVVKAFVKVIKRQKIRIGDIS
jgi:putative nucleotidyltransferase with HDIG domain